MRRGCNPGLVPAPVAPVLEVAEQDHGDEDEPDHEHGEDDVAAFLRGGLGKHESEAHGAATLPNETGMGCEGVVDGPVARTLPRGALEVVRGAVEAQPR